MSDAHGPGPDLARERQEDLAFYMRQLDEGVTRVIGPQATLVLAAAESTWPAFKLASQRRSILDEVIDGNPDRTPDEELRLKGVHLMTPRWQRELNQLAQRYEDALAHRLGSAELAEIVQAASEGRIETLFVVPSASVAGSYDPIHHQATVTDTGDDDLVDLAVLLTVKTSGRLIVVEKTPGGGPAAAIYRY